MKKKKKNKLEITKDESTLKPRKKLLQNKKKQETYLINKQEKTNQTPSKEHIKYLKKIKTEKQLIRAIQFGLLVLLIVLWEVFTHFRILDPFFYSSPFRILAKIKVLVSSGNLFLHIGVTLLETVMGFLFSTIFGTIIAIGLWWNEKLRKIFEPYLVILNALPKIALGPMIIIWVGTGITAILVMCILICIVITIMTMLHAFMACDPDKILLLKSMQASKTQIFFYLIFPNAFGELISVLKINVGLSWVGSIMGEYLASRAGLGYLIVVGSNLQDTHQVMTSTVLLCLLAGLMYFLVSKLENIYKR